MTARHPHKLVGMWLLINPLSLFLLIITSEWSLAFFERSVCNLLTEWLKKTVRTFVSMSGVYYMCDVAQIAWCGLVTLDYCHLLFHIVVNQLGDSRQRVLAASVMLSVLPLKVWRPERARMGSIVSRYTSARAQQRNWFIHIWERFCMYITDRISFSVLKDSEWWIIALRVRDVS